MNNLFEKLKKRKKDNPLKRMLRDDMTEEDKEKYLVHYKEDKLKRLRKKELGL